MSKAINKLFDKTIISFCDHRILNIIEKKSKYFVQCSICGKIIRKAIRS